ncbi:glycine cleavage system protein GcvH [Curtobacterium sp. USHLN213]|uniref:glycine cleavage system protein GcvH n=1 Tax=Curtobacterium sp. USHLN213 TaxID=3081255 RepID=UPI0030194D18
MNLPDDLLYIAEHQWLRRGDEVTIGITDHAQEELGDLVAIELPAVGSRVVADAVCGSVESAKTVSDISSPVTGIVTEHNGAALDDPTIVNDFPYSTGWLFRVAAEADGSLLTADEYRRSLAV